MSTYLDGHFGDAIFNLKTNKLVLLGAKLVFSCRAIFVSVTLMCFSAMLLFFNATLVLFDAMPAFSNSILMFFDMLTRFDASECLANALVPC